MVQENRHRAMKVILPRRSNVEQHRIGLRIANRILKGLRCNAAKSRVRSESGCAHLATKNNRDKKPESCTASGDAEKLCKDLFFCSPLLSGCRLVWLSVVLLLGLLLSVCLLGWTLRAFLCLFTLLFSHLGTYEWSLA